jgi:hypothetical protein
MESREKEVARGRRQSERAAQANEPKRSAHFISPLVLHCIFYNYNKVVVSQYPSIQIFHPCGRNFKVVLPATTSSAARPSSHWCHFNRGNLNL